jgi:hypothetical protein
MVNAKAYEQAIADELQKVGEELACARYPHETNDEFAFRLVACIEDSIDEHESDIAHLDRLRETIKALL